MRTDGSGFVLLHSFAIGTSDGGFPVATLALDASGNLYGMTGIGGSANLGTIFAVTGAAPPPPTTPTPTAFFSVTPCRLVDTRNANGPLGGPALAAGASRTFVLAGNCNIPPTATALAVNVAVTSPTATGNLTLYPGGIARPVTSTINYNIGGTRANNAIVRLGPAGDLVVYCGQGSGTAQMVLDVNGYFQ
jgi:uncharacterized repeat protein (TIGR03803 family)